ncbi:MAG: septal ring lytic transglycosylase RlpA family protein [Candidatus Riflebacteria bacterium]|nr:septal ring lytic transglycosylase RlpA family protein [Candidatus Riflebacteria bacterium]
MHLWLLTVLVWVLLVSSAAPSGLARGKEVIVVKERSLVSRFVYREGSLVTQSSWTPQGRPVRGWTSPLAGLASFYGGGDIFTGSATASGEILNDRAFTAAHRTLQIGTMVRVTNSVNGRSVVVRINDRGPFFRDRVIDLSQSAARTLGVEQSGLAPVTLEILSTPGTGTAGSR